jgi:hypothetical protein
MKGISFLQIAEGILQATEYSCFSDHLEKLEPLIPTSDKVCHRSININDDL